MTGWVLTIGLAALVFLTLLFVGRIPRAAREISAAALLLGLAGYAWQGNPGLPGSPRVAKDDAAGRFDERLAEQRRGLAERYGPAAQWLVMSDAFGRMGKTEESANILLSGLRQAPDDANLWLGMGNALVAHGDGVLSPGAEYAFRRALTLEPQAPGPRFFYGIALANAGQLQRARDLWQPLAERAPAGSQVKAELEANIARIDAMLANGAPAAR